MFLRMWVLLPWLLLGRSLLLWPGLRRRMLLSSRSLLLRCGSFLLRGLLMLRCCQLVLRCRLLGYRSLLLGCGSLLLRGLLMLRCWSLLGQRLYLLYRLHGHSRALLGFRAHLLGWPLRLRLPHLLGRQLGGWLRLWSLLGDACPWYRPFPLRRV